VAQPARFTACSFSGLAFLFSVASLASPLFQSRAAGVAHPATSSTVLRLLSVLPAALYVSVSGDPAIGVGQPASWHVSLRLLRSSESLLCFGDLALAAWICSGVLPPVVSPTRGVGHPEQPLPDVRRADARSRQIRSPEGVALRLQVSPYSIEPFVSKFACNLLPKEAVRATLADEGGQNRPKVP
jgi:hypothetical protein